MNRFSLAKKNHVTLSITLRRWCVTIVLFLGVYSSPLVAARHWGRLTHVQLTSFEKNQSPFKPKASHRQHPLSEHHGISVSNGKERESLVPRGGQAVRFGTVEKTAAAIVGFVSTCVRTCLPPVVALVRAVASIYSVLPTDAIIAQAGIVYSFAGGYYPTLFATLQAAHQCGWQQVTAAIQDLSDEALNAITAMEQTALTTRKNAREIFTETTKVILATVDPMKVRDIVKVQVIE
jgi:hypothetical protein